MAGDQEQSLAQATRRVLAMRKEQLSRAKIADEIGVSPDVVMTIERLGAGKTRRIARGRLLRWMAKTSGAAASAGSGGQASGAPGRRGPGRPPRAASQAASGGSGYATIELDGGQTVRLKAGRRYMLRGSTLYEALGN
jgi:hypothetical protein